LADASTSSIRLVVYDDDDHTFEYVIQAFVEELGVEESRAFDLAREIHESGRTVFTLPDLASAQEAQERLLARGRDPRLARSRTSLLIGIESVTDGAWRTISCGRMTEKGLEPLGPEEIAVLEEKAKQEAVQTAPVRETPTGDEDEAEDEPSTSSIVALALVVFGAILVIMLCAVCVASARSPH